MASSLSLLKPSHHETTFAASSNASSETSSPSIDEKVFLESKPSYSTGHNSMATSTRSSHFSRLVNNSKSSSFSTFVHRNKDTQSGTTIRDPRWTQHEETERETGDDFIFYKSIPNQPIRNHSHTASSTKVGSPLHRRHHRPQKLDYSLYSNEPLSIHPSMQQFYRSQSFHSFKYKSNDSWFSNYRKRYGHDNIQPKEFIEKFFDTDWGIPMVRSSHSSDFQAVLPLKEIIMASKWYHYKVNISSDICWVFANIVISILPNILLDDPSLKEWSDAFSLIRQSYYYNHHHHREKETDNDGESGFSSQNLMKWGRLSDSLQLFYNTNISQRNKNSVNGNEGDSSWSSTSSSSSTDSEGPYSVESSLTNKWFSSRYNNSINASLVTSKTIQTIEFSTFIYDILKTTSLSSLTVLLALLYIHRLRVSYPTARPFRGCEYRLLLVAMILANKYMEDKNYSNKTWSTITGLSVQYINTMEREFLDIIEFDTAVDDVEFYHWMITVEKCIRREHGLLQQQSILPQPSFANICNSRMPQ